jgi:hypothetical protein
MRVLSVVWGTLGRWYVSAALALVLGTGLVGRRHDGARAGVPDKLGLAPQSATSPER